MPLAITMAVALLTAKRGEIATAGDLYGPVEFLCLVGFGTLAAFGAGILSLDEALVRHFVPGGDSAPSTEDSRTV